MRERDYPLAWSVCERSLEERDPTTRDDPSLPYHLRWVWDGRPFEGRHVLVRCYHGLGDTIQFARYLPLLRDKAASVTVEVHPRLVPLLSGTEGIDLVPFDPARPLPPSECDIEIMELAFALRAAPDRTCVPYLSAAPAILPKGTIGVCFKAGDWDLERSVPEYLLRPICVGHHCLTLNPEPTELPVLNQQGCAFDLAVTASLVASVDLVITVDTMIAHLAGALGKPTWLLLKHEPDWRWAPHTGRSDWYPAMRLFAQPHPGAWAPVVQQVARELRTLKITGHREFGR